MIKTENFTSIVEMLESGPRQETEEEKHENKYRGWLANQQEQPYTLADNWLELSNPTYGPNDLEIVAGA